jgi:hypothetical protein
MAEQDRSDEIIERLDRLIKVMEDFAEIYARAEREVPEALHRNTMYYHDLFCIKVAHETSGLPMDPDLNAELDRVHHRLVEHIAEHTTQGGLFHPQYQRFKKEGKTKVNR